MKKRSILVLVILLLSFSPATWGQKIGFRNYTIKQGLPQSTVNCITQDRKGFIWMGTQAGLVRFDGKNFITFTIANGLPDNSINCILEDRAGNLWIGTNQGGVSRFDGFRFRNFSTKNGLVGDEIKQVYQDRRGNIWIRSPYGLSLIQGSKITSFTHKNGLPHNNAMCLAEDSKGNIWCGTQDGIAVLRDGKISTTYRDEVSYFDREIGKQTATIWAIHVDRKGLIWIATQGGGVFRFDGHSFSSLTTRDGLASNTIISIFEDSRHNIWFGTFGKGISYFDGQNVKSIISEELADKFYIKFAEDSLGNIWFQTNNAGVFKYKDGSYANYTTENNLVSDILNDIFVDREGNTWLAAVGGVSVYGKAIFEIYSIDQGLPEKDVAAVYAARNGNIWIGLADQVLRFDKGNFQKIKIPWEKSNQQMLAFYEDAHGGVWSSTFGSVFYSRDGMHFSRMFEIGSKLSINDICGDDKGDIWFGTEQGLYQLENGSSARIVNDSTLARKNIQALLVDSGRNIWAATTEGLVRFDGKKSYVYNIQKGLPNNLCLSLCKDREGNIWVGTDGGLCCFVRKGVNSYQVKSYGLKEGLANTNIMSVVADNENYVWIGHLKGLNRIDIATGKIDYYSELDGFTPIETYQKAVAKDAKGNLWFGTVDGLVKYIPGNNRMNLLPPKTYITAIRFTNQNEPILKYAEGLDSSTHLPLKLHLPHNRNFISFDFIGISLAIPAKVTYQFKLDGYDEQWSAPTSQTSYDYKKLPYGKYTFLLRAFNNDGIGNADPVSFSFEIKPPFWKTAWFILLEILFGIFLVFQFIRYRERQLQEEKRILEQKVKERTAEIEYQKKQIEVANDELREQQQEILAQRDEIERQRDIAEQQRDQIMVQKKEITDSIHYARRIQTALLTPEENAKNILGEYFILFKPRDIVSGDFYWMSRRENKVVVTAADCTGHGVPGAFMSMLGVSLLNEIVNKENTLQADIILNKLRENIKITLSQTGKENEAKDGMDIALCVIDKEAGKLEFAGANNPLFIVRNGELLEFKADNMPIGIHAGEERLFKNNVVDLQKGDMLYLFSDGYADQFGGPEGGKFKTKPFKRLFLEIHMKPMPEQWLLLEETIETWKHGLDQVDDILVIGIRI